MREVIKTIQKQLDAFEKQANAMIAEKVLQEAKELNEKLDECGSVVVHVFSDGANGKVGKKAVVRGAFTTFAL